ncbi:hypothetical protein [Novosphingobium lindaniclasticum]
MMLRAALIILSLLAYPYEVKAKEFSYINITENKEVFTSVGDVVLKVTLKDSLPNIFGKADIWGRKRERGYVEIRYMGIAPDGRAVFRRKTVDIETNESTLSPSQSWSNDATVVQGGGNGTNLAIIGNRGGDATIAHLPPDTIEIALNLPENRILTVERWQIEIQSADAGGIRFIVTKRQ